MPKAVREAPVGTAREGDKEGRDRRVEEVEMESIAAR